MSGNDTTDNNNSARVDIYAPTENCAPANTCAPVGKVAVVGIFQ